MCRSDCLCSQTLVGELADAGVLRVSAYLYNVVSEVEQLHDSLGELSMLLGARG